MTSILEEAAEVRKDRAARVDDPAGNFARIAKIWEVVFGHPVTTKQVALAMIGLKLARECYKPWRDNLVDLAGYADCADEIERPPTVPEYDPIEELYKFRQDCQEERENADTDEAADGDRRPSTSGDGPGIGTPQSRQVRSDSGNSNRSACSGLRGPFGPNGCNPREPLAALSELAGHWNAAVRESQRDLISGRLCISCGRRKEAYGVCEQCHR